MVEVTSISGKVQKQKQLAVNGLFIKSYLLFPSFKQKHHLRYQAGVSNFHFSCSGLQRNQIWVQGASHKVFYFGFYITGRKYINEKVTGDILDTLKPSTYVGNKRFNYVS